MPARSQAKGKREPASVKVADILKAKGFTTVYTVGPRQTLIDAVALACEKRVGALLVVDDDAKPVGIVTERDILYECNARADLTQKTVAETMTQNVISAKPSDDINLAMDIMINQEIRHLPVVDDDNIVGIITIRDLIYAMRKADSADVQYLVEYIKGNIRID